ncbi:diacylglycerol/lipid kinase family protein [Actinomadura rugatobispora]|uniref:Diacylglycerol/lipid kinase family protein n=1 Tax=Actinomadura rugatobispora TaxID=1994 RepID=A0ABW1AH66_9ACTN|nr:diacylglycerol kinase family lipid kinase [Actinomadura rugatobispora]
MLIFTNANAGTHDAETVERVAGLLRSEGGGEVIVQPSRSPEDIDRALDEHAAGLGGAHGPGGRPLVVAAGGDGSIHGLVAALHARGELDRWTVGLLPMGTGNDLARNLGIPLEPERAARLLLGGTTRDLDLLVDEDGGVVLNAVHVGIGAVAARSATRFKPYLKAAAFPLGAVLAGLRESGWRLRVGADGEPVQEGRFLMVALSNASGIAGGSAQLAADGHPADGRLELVISAATGPFARVGYALGLRRGTHRQRDDVIHTTARNVTVTGEEFLANSDGEVTGPYTHRSWTLRGRAWRIVAPADPGGAS